MVNVTDFINESAVVDAAKDTAGEWVANGIKQVIFFSGKIVVWIIGIIEGWGWSMQAYQASALLIFVDLILLYIALKYITKPILRVAIILVLIWFLAGFFVPHIEVEEVLVNNTLNISN